MTTNLNLSILPEETTVQILSYLDLTDLVNCCKVSKTLLRLASDDLLWKNLFKEQLNPENIRL